MPSASQPAQDELTVWLNSAGRYKLLTQEETICLARKIKASEQGSKEYIKLVNKLTQHNLKLVVSFVNSFMKGKTKRNFGCTETMDYLQVGVLGLRRAAECYDHTSGYRFSTYAYPWIRSFVSRYNMKISSLFHIPENQLRDSWFYEKHGYLKTKNKLHFRDESYCKELLQRVRYAQSSMSLDSPINTDDGNSCTLANIIESHYNQSITADEFSSDIEDMIMNAGLAKLQIEILKAFYLESRTLEQIAVQHGVTRDRVKTLKEAAITALRSINGLV